VTFGLAGTLSAVSDALESLSIPEVHLQVVDKGVGPVWHSAPVIITMSIIVMIWQVSSGDIDSAAANGAFIVTFNVKTPSAVQNLASQAAIPMQVSITLTLLLLHSPHSQSCKPSLKLSPLIKRILSK
jgi:hypothetical protein